MGAGRHRIVQLLRLLTLPSPCLGEGRGRSRWPAAARPRLMRRSSKPLARRCWRIQEAGALLAIEPQGRFLFCCASGAPVLSVLRKRGRLASAALAA